MKHTLFILLSFVIKLSFSQCPDGYVLKDSNLVYNGDFTKGNEGFDTEYNYSRDYHWSNVFPLYEAVRRYSVVHGAMYVHPAFANCLDKDGRHTPMLVADGYTGTIDIWSQKVKVKPKTYYYYELYHASSCCWDGLLTEMGLYINEEEVDYGETTDTCRWEQLKHSWYSGEHQEAKLSIKNEAIAWYGNDLMVDHITFKECVLPETLVKKEPIIEVDTVDHDETHDAYIKNNQKINLQAIQFQKNNSELKPSSYERLDLVIDFLKNKGKTLQLELLLHISRPERTKVKTRMLSQQRAEKIKKYMVAKGIKAERITATGLGYSQPLMNDKRKMSAQLNERAELRFYYE